MMGEIDLTVDRLEVETPAPADPLAAISLLVTGRHYAPEPTGHGSSTTALVQALASMAERVTILTGEPGPAAVPGPTGGSRAPVGRRVPRRYDSRHDRVASVSGVQVVRHLSQSESGFVRSVLGARIRHPPGLVIGVTPTPAGALAAAHLAGRYDVPLLIVVLDLLDHRGLRHRLREHRRAGRLAASLRQAARVLIVGEELRERVTALGAAPDRIECLAAAEFGPAPRLETKAARIRLGLAVDGFVVVHSGNMGFGQDLPTVVRAARRIAGPSSGIGFVLAGEGSQRRALELAAADLPGVRFVDPVTAGDYALLLAAADVLVLTERPGRPDRALPSRLQSYLLAGRPIVAAVNPGGESESALRTVPGATLRVPAGDAPALAAAIARLQEHEPERQALTAAARRLADASRPGPPPGSRLRDIVLRTLARS